MSFTSTVFRKPIRPFLSMITTRNTLVSCSILLWHTRPQGLWLLRLLWLLWLLWLLRLLWLFRSFWMTFTLGLKLVQITWPILTLPPTSIMRSSIYIFLFSIFSQTPFIISTTRPIQIFLFCFFVLFQTTSTVISTFRLTPIFSFCFLIVSYVISTATMGCSAFSSASMIFLRRFLSAFVTLSYKKPTTLRIRKSLTIPSIFFPFAISD